MSSLEALTLDHRLLPPGWEDELTADEKASRRERWCVDDGSVGVDYELHISVGLDM